MSKHDPKTGAEFLRLMDGCTDMAENDFQNNLKPTILAVELDDSYNTNEKLKIFSLLSSLSNCSENERQKYVKKIYKVLK